MLCGVWTRVNPGNRVLGGSPNPRGKGQFAGTCLGPLRSIGVSPSYSLGGSCDAAVQCQQAYAATCYRCPNTMPHDAALRPISAKSKLELHLHPAIWTKVWPRSQLAVTRTWYMYVRATTDASIVLVPSATRFHLSALDECSSWHFPGPAASTGSARLLTQSHGHNFIPFTRGRQQWIGSLCGHR